MALDHSGSSKVDHFWVPFCAKAPSELINSEWKGIEENTEKKGIASRESANMAWPNESLELEIGNLMHHLAE